MPFTRSVFFLVAAAVCFTVALLLSTAVVHGGNTVAWAVGGLLALTLSFLP